MNWIYISNVLSEDKEINTNAFFSRNMQGKKIVDFEFKMYVLILE
jgi:hypothetical protein